MACLKMILAHRTGTIIPIVLLGKNCAKYGGYDMPLESSMGLKYAPFVRYLRGEFRISAKVASPLPISQVIYELAHGSYVMASVSSSIRDPKSKPNNRGGHLVLILGYDLHEQMLYMHNPSGGSLKSDAYAEVSFKDFTKFSATRGVVIF